MSTPIDDDNKCERCGDGINAGSRFQLLFEHIIIVTVSAQWKNGRKCRLCLDCLREALVIQDVEWSKLR